MAKVVKQYRYSGDSFKEKNQPENLTLKELSSGSVFFINNLKSIIQLGIQTLPGTKFKLNNGEEIIIGSTGIYELELSGISEITGLSFNEQSLQLINELGSAFLIVDALYEIEED